ncbi:Helicase with zinc finger domain 2 [Apodemus speciosus]|uniref:RNA helicase n=1 Tax=Apodemus speciosus TaxID=105296 RepID=A0ABQ0EKL8_APOSI
MASGGCSLRSGSTSTTNGPCLAELYAKVDLHLGCSRCTQCLNESTYILHEVEHTCPREILLARFKQAAKSKIWRKVGLRPSFPTPMRYQVCHFYSPGLGCRRHWNRCTFASSSEEALVWTFERKYNLPRLKLKEAVQGTRAPDRLQTPADTIRAEFGGHFQLLCALCFKCRPPCLCPVDPRGHCPKHQICPTLLIHVIVEGQKRQFVEVRPLPQRRHPLNYCKYVGRGVPCYHGASRCGFAHSAVEMAVWKAEQLDGLQRGDLLTYPLSGEDKRKAGPSQPPVVKLYCQACLVTCNSQEAFENHCSSLEHAQMVAFDQAVPWKHRAPPMGLSKFELCPRPDLCEHGEVCIKAHSKEELQEWVQRAQDMELRKQAAWQDGLVPYQARLLAEYQRSSREVSVMAETVRGVSVTCHQPLVHQAQEKKTQHKWVFTIHSEETPCYMWPYSSKSLEQPSHWFPRVFRHTSSMHRESTFVCTTPQLNSRPVLLQKLKLQLGQTHNLGLNGKPAPSHPRELECWHTGNRHVVLEVDWTPEQEALMAKYKLPSLALEFNQNVLVWGPISRTNYRQRMHKFLYEEEAAQQQLVAKLAMKGQVSLKTALETPALGMLFAPPGALYAEVPFPSSLLPDTDQGFLLSRAVTTALVAPVPASNSTVYQVRLEARASSEHALWLLLPARCCTALGLQAQDSPILEVQFQIDPLTFRFWHQAVDALPEERLVVPDLPACTLPYPWPTPPSFRGNHKQKLAVGLIAGRRPEGTKHIPPLLIYGPFGTGKTYTLAMAALEVVQQPQTKVLICTHTNSAADIYIREYFHSYVSSGHPEATPLRVMYADRPPRQTDSTTLQYCCLTEDRQAFRPPTGSELVHHRLVVTTTSQARELQVPAGFFSHIFIDEAAQMLECEALIPLSYALSLTRVVLAGDHMQVTPRLFSVPRDKAAGHTLLHRLFLYYQQEVHKIAQQSRIIFHENYRSTAAIINFVSHHFYLAKGNPIQASGKVPCHPQHYPLMFCHVAGSPEQDMSMTSWLNSAEVTQVVEKVQEIYNTWPHCWGPREQRHICAVSHGAQWREFRVVVLSSVHNCNSLLSPGAPTSEFFTEPRVLNTVMTRAQSQLVAVGDAVALCSSGACRNLWKSFIRECIEHHSVFPEELSLEQVEQGVAQRQNWASLTLKVGGPEAEHTSMARDLQRPIAEGTMATVKAETSARAASTAQTERVAAGDTARGNSALRETAAEVSTLESGISEEDSDSDFWPSGWELNADDAILKELLDESRQVTVTVREDGLLDTMVCPAFAQKARQYTNLPSSMLRKFLRSDPKQYRRCSFLKETFERALAMPLDDTASSPIQIRGRLNCGMAFTGDEVLVKILGPAVDDRSIPGSLQGRVIGVLKRRKHELAFVCRMDEWDPRIMIPINGSVTKIFVAEMKDPQQVPIHSLVQGQVQRVRHETLKPEDRSTRLFWVRIVLWRERFYYPLGIILEVLPKAITWEQGLHILDLEHGLKAHTPDPASVSKALQRYHSELNMAAGHREDYRHFLTFTVDPQGACNLDDALSVRDLGPVYEVAVHIADVASLVPKDGALDVEARQQGTVFYAPSREPVLMLPASLCQDALSLLPGQDRLAISLILTMEKGSGQIKSLRFAPSIVRSDRQLSYEEAEELIKRHPGAGLDLPTHLDSVEDCVVAACYFSWMLRRQRLPAACYYEQPDEDSVLGFRTAHIMVQEYMIQFNSHVAEFLVDNKHTQTLTPLRWQPTPTRQQLDSVFKKHRGLVPLSLHLCHHSNTHYTPNKQLHLLTSLWKQVQLAAGTQDYSQMVDLIAADDMHPSLAPACLDFRRALGRSVFGRSCQGKQQPAGHYSLQVDWYTWATSPIRRYLDVVLQRLILLALGHRGCTYSNRDIDWLCLDFSRQHASAQSYQRRACSLHLAIQLKTQTQNKLGFVVDVEMGAHCFKVLFPINRETLPDPCPIHYHSLQLAEHPQELLSQTGLRLVWRRRMYSVQASKLPLPLLGTSFDPHIQTVDAALWMKLLMLLKEQRWPEIAAVIQEQDKLSHRREKVQIHQSCCGHFVEVAYELGSGDTLQVQLGSSLQRGFLAPTLQLWTVVPGFSLCLEHMERPGDCFSSHVYQALKDRYLEVREYSGVWGPRCALESLTSAVTENDSIVLQDVHISWDTSQGQLQGTFQLEAAFLQEKCINIHFDCCYLCIRLEGLPLPLASSFPGPSGLGPFLNIDPNTYTWVAHGLSGDWDHELTGDWDQENVDDRQEVPKQVHFSIHHMTMEKVPEEVLRPSTRFTVEVLSKQLPDLRKEEAVRQLKWASPLVISIALGLPIPESRRPVSGHRRPVSEPHRPISRSCRPISELHRPIPEPCHPIPEPCRRGGGWPHQHSFHKVIFGFCYTHTPTPAPTNRFLERQNYNIPAGHHKLNPSQDRAVRSALQKQFTVIQGPPGTGKTIVGYHIVYWFHRSNQEQMPTGSSPSGEEQLGGPCVLYCGPSNKSVDVLGGLLLKKKTEMRPLRVYGEQAEATEFPLPGVSSRSLFGKTSHEGRPNQSLRSITLHHRIRRAPNPYAAEIRKFDAQLREGKIFSREDLMVYKRVLGKARKYELERHSVILCTCSCAASGSLKNLNVRQILVDEAGMATEPETLIPLVRFSKTEKVVLLGDHKQLRPVVKNEQLRNLGMDRSLFERYHRDAIMLDTQYRMHKDICSFPSMEFYGGKLKTWSDLRRPPSLLGHVGKQSCSVIFGSVQGHEQKLLVSTEDGNENSRANPEEVTEVVRIIKQLTLDRTVDPKDIAVLTPYNAQAAAISRGLMQRGVTGVTVTSITKSQGSEWRYVIVSTVRTCPRSDVDQRPTKSWLKKFLGFVVDPHQVNVAITRAQEGLCIIGTIYCYAAAHSGAVS